ncbi:MAG: hypothetical protein JRJ27_17790 [Deltaproteobacteria bacterium]|nr:hypothetical protein [Deltaproteobacteria bacterium]MBW2363554.1 hypothetical protein [Deltaproteobacteria bacterium]
MDCKPGWKTTEFWVTLGIQIVGVLLLTGILSPDEATKLNTALPDAGILVDKIITQVTALAAIVVSAYRYVVGRSDVKKG